MDDRRPYAVEPTEGGSAACNQNRREGTAVTPQNLASTLILAIGSAKPRSKFVSWFLDDDAVEQLVTIVAVDVAEKERIA